MDYSYFSSDYDYAYSSGKSGCPLMLSVRTSDYDYAYSSGKSGCPLMFSVRTSDYDYAYSSGKSGCPLMLSVRTSTCVQCFGFFLKMLCESGKITLNCCMCYDRVTPLGLLSSLALLQYMDPICRLFPQHHQSIHR